MISSKNFKYFFIVLCATFFLFSVARANASDPDNTEAAYQKLKSLKAHYEQISMHHRELISRGNPRDKRCITAQQAMIKLKNEIARYTLIVQGLEARDAADAQAAIDAQAAAAASTVNSPAPSDLTIEDQADINSDVIDNTLNNLDDTADILPVDLSAADITPPPADPDFTIIDDPADTTDTADPNDTVTSGVDDNLLADSIDDINAGSDSGIKAAVSDVTSNPAEPGDFIMAVSPDKDLVLVSEPGSSEASGSVSNGQILQILETQGDWVKICYAPGKTGWIKKDLLAAQSDAGTIGVPPAAPPSILDPAVTDNRPSSGTNTSVPDPNDTVADNTVADNTVAGTDTSKTDNQAKDNTDTGKKDTKDPIIEPDSNFEKYSSKEVIVKVPQRTQYDPANGEYQNSWCGPTSLAMIFEFYGIKKTTSQVAENTYNFAQRNGTPSNKLAREAQLAGFEASRVETGKDLDFLEKTCREGKPVIVNVDVAWKSGHYMVVVGMTDDKVIVNDPGRREVRRELDKEWFMTQWEGRSKRVIIIE